MTHTYTPSIHPPKNLGSEEINKNMSGNMVHNKKQLPHIFEPQKTAKP